MPAELVLGEAGTQKLLGELAHFFQLRTRCIEESHDRFFGGVDIAVGDVVAEIVAIQKVGNVGRFWAQEQDRPCDGHGAIHLAGVNDADHVGAEADDVHVGGREREPQISQRLIGEGDHIGEVVILDGLLDFLLAGAAADEEEADIAVILEAHGGVEDGLERVGWAVVAAVHEDEFVLEVVLEAEGVGLRIDRLDEALVRPGRNGDQLVRGWFCDFADAPP